MQTPSERADIQLPKCPSTPTGNAELPAPDKPPSPAEPAAIPTALVAAAAPPLALLANPEKPGPVHPAPVNPPPPLLKPRAPLPRNLGVGTADLRTPAEDIQFQK